MALVGAIGLSKEDAHRMPIVEDHGGTIEQDSCGLDFLKPAQRKSICKDVR